MKDLFNLVFHFYSFWFSLYEGSLLSCIPFLQFSGSLCMKDLFNLVQWIKNINQGQLRPMRKFPLIKLYPPPFIANSTSPFPLIRNLSRGNWVNKEEGGGGGDQDIFTVFKNTSKNKVRGSRVRSIFWPFRFKYFTQGKY